MAVNLAVGPKAPSYNLPRDAGGHISSPDFKRHKLAIYRRGRIARIWRKVRGSTAMPPKVITAAQAL
jgi:hypothetical protein